MINNKEKNFISAVFYIHDDENLIGYFLDNLIKVMSENFEKYEIICVNDASKDKSLEIVKSFASKLSGAVMNIVNMSYYQGREASMNAGVDLSIGDFVFEFDNIYIDYDINLIMDIYFKSLEGFDIVSAAPKKIRLATSKIFYSIFNYATKQSSNIRTEVFRILSRRAINRVSSMSKTIPYRKAIYSNCGLKTTFILYDNNMTKFSDKKEHKSARKDMAVNSLILFTDIAYKVSIGFSAIMMLIAIFIGIYAFTIFFGNYHPVEGWTTTVLFLSLTFFGLFAILSVILKYLSVIIDLIFSKQKYIVESIEKING